MLSFGTALASQLKNANPVSFWVLKLFHSDEGTSDFIGVSDQDRVDGGDFYHGIVASWGNLNQSLDFYKFETTQANMTVTLINTENSVDGGRFSDLFASNNYINRKWELFQVTTGFSTWDVSTNLIGSGVIAGDIKYNTEKITLTLLDNSSRFHRQAPYHAVDSATYTNAPSSNIGAPVPMSYGDFGQDTTTGDFENHWVKGHFPAIIVDKEDSSGFTVALPDTNQPYVNYAGDEVDLTELLQFYANNVYLGLEGIYLQCAGANTKVGDASANTDDAPTQDGHNILYISGSSFFAYFDLESASSTTGITSGDVSNWFDRNLTTEATLGAGNAQDSSVRMRIPDIPKVGTLSSDAKVDVLIQKLGTGGIGTGTVIIEGSYPGDAKTITYGSGHEMESMSGAFDANQRESLDFSSENIGLNIESAGDGAVGLRISQVGLQIELQPLKKHGKPVYKQEIIYTGEYNDPGGYKIVNTEVNTAITGSNLQYIYYAGKGRKFGAWIDADSRDNGYDDDDLIANPIYIIENILRTELGLSSDEIDYETFDDSGDTSDGHVKNVFDSTVANIKFAFSHYKFMDSRELINRLAKQCCSYVFIGGDGKFKIKTLQKAADYGSANKTIDYFDINLKGISKTPLSAIKNDVTVNYAFDYLDESFTKTKNRTDGTSAGTGTTGYNQSFKLKLDASGILDDDTADNLAIAYKDLFKDQKIVLDFDCLRPYYNDLEMGDIIVFENWDSKIKIYGTAMGTDYYMVSSISKTPFGCSIKAIKVS